MTMHTPEQIEKWAREAGFPRSEFGFSKALINDLTRFAALVAQHERERCAKLCADGVGSGPENGCCPTFWDEAQDACAAAIRNSDGG